MSTTVDTATMNAMVFEQHGGPEQLRPRCLPVPAPAAGEVRIRVRAFGVNSAEMHMRAGHWGPVAPVTGIECVGEVDLDPSGRLPHGQMVAAVCGGFGRTRNGSYAEFTVAPAGNVFVLNSHLSWTDLAAIPESYATAWVALFDNLRLQRSHVILVRGGTSALGQAAINLALDAGATVLTTTRDRARSVLLTALGAERVLIDDGALYETVLASYPDGIDGVLDIVGTSTLRDSLRMVHKGGAVCQVGFLGGLGPLTEFNPVVDLPSGVDLNAFASAFVLGSPAYPIDRIPMQRIVDGVAAGVYRAKPVRIFDFADIVEAHRLMESGQAGGKIVVRM